MKNTMGIAGTSEVEVGSSLRELYGGRSKTQFRDLTRQGPNAWLILGFGLELVLGLVLDLALGLGFVLHLVLGLVLVIRLGLGFWSWSCSWSCSFC